MCSTNRMCAALIKEFDLRYAYHFFGKLNIVICPFHVCLLVLNANENRSMSNYQMLKCVSLKCSRLLSPVSRLYITLKLVQI